MFELSVENRDKFKSKANEIYFSSHNNDEMQGVDSAPRSPNLLKCGNSLFSFVKCPHQCYQHPNKTPVCLLSSEFAAFFDQSPQPHPSLVAGCAQAL